MKRVLISVLLLALAACSSRQELLSEGKTLCRDGVEYISIATTHGGNIVPHMKPGGGVFTCQNA